MNIKDVRRLYCAAAVRYMATRDPDSLLWWTAAGAILAGVVVHNLRRYGADPVAFAGFSIEGFEASADLQREIAVATIRDQRRERFPGVTPATPETTAS